jgi:hypothetical protein
VGRCATNQEATAAAGWERHVTSNSSTSLRAGRNVMSPGSLAPARYIAFDLVALVAERGKEFPAA